MALRYLTAGESHGPALCGIIDGMPAGVEICQQDFDRLMQKRWAGYGRGKRREIENDRVEVLAGIVAGKTIGSPIALQIKNQDYSAHKSAMAPFGNSSLRDQLPVPLPGHADFAGAVKFGFSDCRFIRERASARETAMRVALSLPARNLLSALGVNFLCMVESIGGIDANIDFSQPPEVLAGLVEENGPEFLTSDREVCEKWRQLIDATAEKGGSVGGTAAVIFWNLPAGLGSHTQADQRLDGIFAARLMSIPAVKGFEIGHAYELSRMSGSCVDSLFFDNRNGFVRRTNFAGGLEGGMTNGAPLLIRFHLKPIPGGTSSDSINLQTGEKARPASYRSDVQVMQAAAVVAESVLAIELASQILEATGGFNLDLIMQRFEQLKPAF